MESTIRWRGGRGRRGVRPRRAQAQGRGGGVRAWGQESQAPGSNTRAGCPAKLMSCSQPEHRDAREASTGAGSRDVAFPDAQGT